MCETGLANKALCSSFSSPEQWTAQLWELVLLALNQALKLDPEAATKLAPLNGKTVSLSLDGVPFVAWVRFEDGTVQSLATQEHADLALSGNLGGYVSLVRQNERHPDDRLRLMGDVHDAQVLQSALKTLKPDIEAACVATFGAARGKTIYQQWQWVYQHGQSALAGGRERWQRWQQSCWVSVEEYAPVVKQIAALHARLQGLEQLLGGK